jgi:hypothetical protein
VEKFRDEIQRLAFLASVDFFIRLSDEKINRNFGVEK